VIKDPNVSRQHAVIEKHGDVYVIVDLGSTNGVVHEGRRVKQHIIEDGNLFYICEHELRFEFD
jgi:pSer/pThr/pTyr-binding forkhead associated (FHA) protein